MNTLTYDYIVIGGGLFGAYSALYLAKNGLRVALLEKENALFQKASVVNQARLHGGYHYPRSIATARMSDDNKQRFTEEHKDFILFEYEKYYAIDRYNSLTDAAQFERFCDYLSLKCERVREHETINLNRLEALYLTTEYTFDPFLIAHYYRQQIDKEPLIDIYFQSAPKAAEKEGSHWRVLMPNEISLKASSVINATYSGSNSILALFGLPQMRLMHEISEIALVECAALKNVGLTIMDGPFGSLMPYGKSGLHSLSSVAYTHHKVSYEPIPTFDCQLGRNNCQPQLPGNCNHCGGQPSSNIHKMRSQMEQYLAEGLHLHHFQSLFTIKTKLQANFIDDGRPTEIAQLSSGPDFYSIFAGKINSIYEIEKVVVV